MSTTWNILAKRSVVSVLNVYNKLGINYNQAGVTYGGSITTPTAWTFINKSS